MIGDWVILNIEEFKIIVEKRSYSYVARPLGISGVANGEGGTYEAAIADFSLLPFTPGGFPLY